MSKSSENKPEDHKPKQDLKGELAEIVKEIGSGTIDNEKLAQLITNEIAQALVDLAKEVEAGKIGNEELALYLARIFRKLGKRRGKTLKKKKKGPQTIFDILMQQILRTFVKMDIARRRQSDQQLQPGYLTKNLIADLDSTINSLVTAPRLDSDMNDIRLIEDVIAINQKLAALSGRTSGLVKGMSTRLISAMSAIAGVGGMKGIATLSTLQAGVAVESWHDATKINYESVSGHVDDLPEDVEYLKEKMQAKLMSKSLSVEKDYGIKDLPITEEAKKLKEKRNLEWENSLSIVRTIDK